MQRRVYVLILVIALALILLLILRPFIIPVYRVKPPTTGAAYDPGALIIDEERAEKILNKIGLSIDDIIVKKERIYYLIPLVKIGYYINNTFYKLGEVDPAYLKKIGLDNFYVVLTPDESRLIILMGTSNLKPFPLRSRPPVIIKEKNGTLIYNTSKRVIYPFSIDDLPNTLTFISIEIDKSMKIEDLEKQKHDLVERFRESIEEEKEMIRKYGNRSIFEYTGPRVPSKIIYINGWPVLFAPMHDVCDDRITHKICFTMSAVTATWYGNVHIVVQSLVSDDEAIEQMKSFLNKIMGER